MSYLGISAKSLGLALYAATTVFLLSILVTTTLGHPHSYFSALLMVPAGLAIHHIRVRDLRRLRDRA